jgi:hypothetical protein
MLADRGVELAHTTVFRWIQVYTPKIKKRLRPYLLPGNGSWQVGEAYVRVKGHWMYLYRAVGGTRTPRSAFSAGPSASRIEPTRAASRWTRTSHTHVLWLR